MSVAAPLVLRDGDRSRLEALTRSSSIRAGLAGRARIVLLAAEGLSNAEIARRTGTSRPTVVDWRARYDAGGIGSLQDMARSGRPPEIDEIDGPGRAPDLRQPGHPQDPGDSRLAGPPPPLPPALHPDRLLLDQPGRTLVRNPHRPTHPPRSPPQRGGPGERRPRVDQELERGPETVHLDQDGRGHPPIPRKIYRENFRRRTLVSRAG